jgi:hypothetical protein
MVVAGCGNEPADELIDYTARSEAGITIASPADVSKLTGAPEDFKAYMAGKIESLVQAAGSDDACGRPQVSVDAIDLGAFAVGSEFSEGCGGAAFIWARQDGVWQQVWGGQDIPGCKDLMKHRVPPRLYRIFSDDISGGEQIGECTSFDGDGSYEWVPYEG